MDLKKGYKLTGNYNFVAPVLLVDDDPDHLLIISAIIEERGIPVVACESAREAARVLTAMPISCLVCDVKMPKVSGLQFITTIRNSSKVPDLPVVMLSASGEDIEFDCLERGANMFCNKSDARSLLPQQLLFLLS